MPNTNGPNQRLLELRLLVLLGLVLVATGCRSLSPRGAVSESVMTCRQLSQQAALEMEQGRWQQAETLITQAIDACSTNAEARRNYAEVLEQRGQIDQAVEQLNKSLEIEQNALTLVHTGQLLLSSGKTDLALWRAEQALSEDATCGAAWALRGRVMAKQADYERSLADLHRSLDYDPKNLQVQLEVAELYQHRGQPRRVLATVQHLLGSCPAEQSPSRAWLLQGLAYQALGRYSDASESLTIACRDTQDSQMLYHLGQAQLLAGQSAAAESSLQQALTLNQSHQPSLALLNRLRNETAQRSNNPRLR